MALSTSNLVTPKQAALNNKINPNPLLSGFSGVLKNNPASATTPTNSSPRAGVSSLSSLQSAGLLTPTTAPKSVTHTDPIGNSTVVTYHAPDTGVKTADSNTQPTPQQNPPQQTNTNTSVTPPPPTYSGLVGQLAQTSSKPNQQYLDSLAKAEEYNKALQESRTNEANAIAGIEGTPIPLEFQQGRKNVLQSQYTAQQAALASALQGESNIAGLGNTQQQIEQGGLGTAAGLAAPQSYGLTNQPYNPLTDTYGGGGSTGVLDRASLAGRVAGTQAAAAAPGNIQAQQLGQVETYKSALQQGQNLQSQLNDLITTFGLNPSNINAVNSGLQKIAQNTSDPHYKALVNYVNDIANTYSQVLTPAGGSATDTTRGIAQSMLDATASGQSLISVMQSLDAAAQAKIAGVQTIGSTGGSGNSGGSYTSSSGNTYKLPY